MSYAVDGNQYVAIASGSDLFSFALPRQQVPGHDALMSPRQH